jgi:hypothetical protein
MDITWSDFWSICKDYILPESGTLILSLLLCGIVGLVVAIAILVVGQRYQAFSRTEKYYNWAVKLYIPLILLGTIYFSLQLGLFRGIYKVMDNQTPALTEGIYGLTVGQIASTQAEKEAYVEAMKVYLVTYDGVTQSMAERFKQDIMTRNTGYGLVDQAKDKVAAWLIDQFKDQIFSAILAALISEATEKAGARADFTWRESSQLMDALLHTDAAHLERAIQNKITEMLQHLFQGQYSSMRTSTFIAWFFIVLFVPLLEWFVYLRWLRSWLARRRAAVREM